MVALTVAGRASWRASDLELRTPPPSYTASTLKQFHLRGYRPAELFFVIGADAFAEIESWKDYPALLGYAHFAVVSRPGHPVHSLPVQMPHLARLMTNSAIGPESLDTPVDHFDRCGDRRRVVHGHPRAARRGPADHRHGGPRCPATH